MPDINKVINQPEYDFLMHAPLGAERSIMFLTFGGSHSYGTAVETSDIDIRGVCTQSRRDLLGMSNFEQFINNPTDTTVYGFNKAVSLFLSCNPNMVEMFGCKPEHYAMVSLTGRMLLDNEKLFLSNRCINSFGGYAAQQLHRLENAIARDRMTQAEQEEHILRSCQNACDAMSGRYKDFGENGLTLYVGDSEKETFEKEILMDINLRGYPLRDFCGAWNDLRDICKNYGNLPHRDKKKDDHHLAKHMMHLFRLNLMCYDLLTEGKVVTYREKDHNFLMEIRNGKFIDADGRVLPDFYEALHETEEKLEYAKKHSILPDKPDMKKVEELVMEINHKTVI